MSGWEVIGLVLALYPIVETAVKLYGEAKPGHTASCLIRKLKTEALIYDQFVRNLLEPVVPPSVIERLLDRSSSDLAGTWRDGELHKELLDRLGPIKSSHLLDLLLDMNKRLKALEIELTNISRGTEVLEKFRTRLRAARASSPKSRVQMNLIAVSEINRDLRRLLEADAISISHPITQCKASRPECTRFLHRENIDLRELYDIMRHGYDCTCDEPHRATLGCHCPSCQAPFSPTKSSSSCWTPELILWPNHTTDSVPESTVSTNGKEKAILDDNPNEANTIHKARATSLPAPELRSLSEASQKRRSCSISVSPCRESGLSDKKEVIQDLCAAINNFQGETEQKEANLGVLQKENKKYRLSINKGQSTEAGANNILRTSDLIKTGAPALSTKKRLQIAFQLCLAVLQLCTTPWIDNSWNWDEHCFVRKIEVQIDERVEDEEYSEPQDDTYSLFVMQQFYSSQLAVQRSEITKPDTVLNLLVGEPTGFVLVKLGCALIELGFGKTMQDIRDEKPSNWLGGLEKTLDPASLDFVTASKLLDSGSVKAEVGIDYANIVKACINRQYQDAQESCIKEFSFRGEKFFDCAEEAIMNPLFDWVKVFG